MQLDVSLNALVGLGAGRSPKGVELTPVEERGLPQSSRVYDAGLWQGRDLPCALSFPDRSVRRGAIDRKHGMSHRVRSPRLVILTLWRRWLSRSQLG